jgi:hypothetical protein
MGCVPSLEASEEGRKNLEEYLRKSGLWEQVSRLDLKSLKKAIADGAFDDARASRFFPCLFTFAFLF